MVFFFVTYYSWAIYLIYIKVVLYLQRINKVLNRKQPKLAIAGMIASLIHEPSGVEKKKLF